MTFSADGITNVDLIDPIDSHNITCLHSVNFNLLKLAVCEDVLRLSLPYLFTTIIADSKLHTRPYGTRQHTSNSYPAFVFVVVHARHLQLQWTIRNDFWGRYVLQNRIE